MVTNSSGWTARRPVKIICVILIPVMVFLVCLGAIGVILGDFEDFEILFADIYGNDYFYVKNIPNVLSLTQTVFLYQSEENIRDMGCLEWQSSIHSNWPYDEGEAAEEWFALVQIFEESGLHMREWGSVKSTDPENPETRRLIDDAINMQIYEYNYNVKKLGEIEGLYYLVTDGNRTLTNLVIERDADFFRSHPVHLVKEIGDNIDDRSRFINSRFNGGYEWDYSRLAIYIAFSSDAVNAQNAASALAQRELSIYVSLIAGAGVALLLLFIILVAGAGRKRGDSNIHFIAPDKIWLDLGLAALVLYEIIICYGFYTFVNIAWRYDSIPRIIALCAMLSILYTAPLAGWLASFSKHCKTGGWWRRTMIYILLHGAFSGLTRFAKSLWAGFSLTVKIVSISAALFFAIVICIFMDSRELAFIICILITSLTVFAFLRYARRLYLVEQGARRAGGGNYDESIAVEGGELGSIAASINSISDGINAAVAERMKSERLKTELITNISHDIRTPLTSMITYADLLKNEGLDNTKAPEYLDILIQKSARLKTLTDDLFEASKAASGNVDAHIENLDLADFVRQVLGELDERVHESGLDFRQNLPEHAPVCADGKLLWRVVENLLSNVFKYAAPGSRVYVDVAPEDGSYRLDIKNISERPLNIDPSELTERFKRGDSSRSGDGNGLGLSIAQSFAQAQGGRFALTVDGDLFKVSVLLPANESS